MMPVNDLLAHPESQTGTPDAFVVTSASKIVLSTSEPPRNICETATFDPKYAIPLSVYQPYIYLGFRACYGITRFKQTIWTAHSHPQLRAILNSGLASDTSPGVAPGARVTAFRMLTGPPPATSLWLQGDTAGTISQLTARVATLAPALD